ncbi:TPA: DUF2971 domain-containing protein [Streptococcus suis]|nr:DUF2971 domain-containing protein [Streptococcus suis]
MKYFDKSKTTDEVVTEIEKLEGTKLEEEFLQFIKDCERIEFLSKEYVESFFKILGTFLYAIFPYAESTLDSEDLKKLLVLFHTEIKKGGLGEQVFYGDPLKISTYFRLFDAFIFEVDAYNQIRVFIDEGSIFDTLLKREDSVSDNLTNFNILLRISYIDVFFYVPETDKEELRDQIYPYIRKLLQYVEDLDVICLYYLLLSNERIQILDRTDLRRINQYVKKNKQNNKQFVQEYLDYLKELGADAIAESQEILQDLNKHTDSDIIKSQIIELLDLTILPVSEPHSNKEIVEQIKGAIDEIRSALMVDAKKLRDNEFYGHYTKIDTLVNFLFIPETKENKNHPTYLRLSNANQLNDPMEGKALLAVLGLDSHMEQCYRSTNVFLSSLTVVKDSLPMWKEYAEESRGAFLEYDQDYLETIVKHDVIEFAKVHYITTDENQNIIGDKPVDQRLRYIKDNIERLEEEGAFEEIREIIDYIAKVSYLFKVSDYQYESEYRILVNLDDTYFTSKFTDRLNSEKVSLISGEEVSKEVFEKYIKDETALRKLDTSIGLLEAENVNYTDSRKYIHIEKSEQGKCNLYAYINVSSLKYSKIMLGPKVENVDYIAPYIHYIQPDIIIETSSIPYR